MSFQHTSNVVSAISAQVKGHFSNQSLTLEDGCHWALKKTESARPRHAVSITPCQHSTTRMESETVHFQDQSTPSHSYEGATLRGELVAEECVENELAFQCEGEDEEVVITRANLYGSSAKLVDTCTVAPYMVEHKKMSFLHHINKQCSGKRECHFSVWQHVPGAKKDSDYWNGGLLRVNYACVPKAQFERTCDTVLAEQTGWVQNVGYPEYYLGQSGECTMTIRVDEGQQIALTFTDIHMREIIQPMEKECRDSISVQEGSKQLLFRCGELKKPLTIESEGNALNITMKTSIDLFPKRGFVAHFQAVGCESPATPEDGYRSFRNDTHAEYLCCVQHLFPDTLTRHRVLYCLDGYMWNDTLPDCVDMDDLLAEGKLSEEQYHHLYNGSSSPGTAHAEFLKQPDFVFDLVLPTIIMSVLVVGNVVVVFLIIYCRRSTIEEAVRNEELESIKANPESTDGEATSPCSV
ncbi:uncharacterized protein LOC143035585 [Oratosquilla oratoria]|uniref:uncharacterized protein LOC143035585 n=1 Tax=Oratosquilla oratoria TaxID=337810 RepID=UPI003F75F6B6